MLFMWDQSRKDVAEVFCGHPNFLLTRWDGRSCFIKYLTGDLLHVIILKNKGPWNRNKKLTVHLVFKSWFSWCAGKELTKLSQNLNKLSLVYNGVIILHEKTLNWDLYIYSQIFCSIFEALIKLNCVQISKRGLPQSDLFLLN